MRVVLLSLILPACGARRPPEEAGAVDTRVAIAVAPVDEGAPRCLRRADLDALVGEPEAIGRLGRLLPHRGPDGELDGLRVSAVQAGSLPDQLGVRNGDLLRAVAGVPLTSLQGALEAWAGVQGADQVVVDLSRHGLPHQLVIDVRDTCPDPPP